MTTDTWHAEGALLTAYVEGRLGAIEGASVEQHLLQCGRCRVAVGPLVDPRLVARGWSGVLDAVQTPRSPLPIRLARRLGLAEPTAVLLAATASLRSAWLVGAFLALVFATAAAWSADDGLLAPFLLVAPLAPVIGVAAAYGHHQDPLETLVVTAPYGRTRLILVRTLGVLVSVVPGTVLLGLLLPGPPWLAAAWLGPALALVPLLLALAGYVGPRVAVGLVAVGWCGVVVFSLRGLPPTWPVEAAQQAAYLAVGLVSLAVLALRARGDRRIGALL